MDGLWIGGIGSWHLGRERHEEGPDSARQHRDPTPGPPPHPEMIAESPFRSTERGIEDGRYGHLHMADLPAPDHLAEFDRFVELAAARRSILRIDPDRAVDPALIDRLLATAATAPNHRRTFPWRFRVITGEGRRRLGEALAATVLAEAGPDADADPAKVAKARSKYLRAPVVLVIASRAGDDPITTAENRDAVAAAVQTLLLGATAAGLASLWSTGLAALSPEVAELCQFDASDTILGLVYLGHPTATLEPIERPQPESLWLDPA